ncbi:hypothetical protein APC1461_1296 [Bifidobacterium longum]|uniref:Metal-independent alpha-mannosidase n=1 Tax=Bifidobacterium longum TaxID=216816 RepID=A0A2N0TI90_BIFLN|nr:glycoside hydrolase family 125 protein [Bifidobacterium longum]PKD14459.1 hypothetical protein APC1461_1296 [Bifidobacterium longum]
MQYETIPASVQAFMDRITALCGEEHADWARNFNACFANTLTTTVRRHEDGTTFVLTGDIPAMWLRDSTAQVRPYLAIAGDDPDLADMIAGLVRLQFRYIGIDAYANAFNEEPNGHTWDPNDRSDFSSPWLWERKYELDSLCYPLQLAWLLYANTGHTDHFDATFAAGVRRILDVIETEQDHAARSPYFFVRDCDIPTESLANDGKGTPVAVTGMTWSGFRPSDDACTYHYLVPANMFAVVVLGYVERIFTEVTPDADLAARAGRLAGEIREGIEAHARVRNAAGEPIYAYEVDGLGHALVMDDANVPSLLAAPYLGYCAADDPTYQAMRRTLLSGENPFYYAGEHTAGIGSPHTPPRYVWPIARSIEGLTCPSQEEKAAILDNLVAIDAGTNLMHEGVCVDDPTQYTREWFSWSNMMFCELVMDYFGIRVKR